MKTRDDFANQFLDLLPTTAYPPREDVLKIVDEILASKPAEVCSWLLHEDGRYDTGCGTVFEFTNDTVEANGFVFCPFCGKTITVELSQLKGHP